MDDLKALNDAATQGKWVTLGTSAGCVFVEDRPIQRHSVANSSLACALVNAYRAGGLVPAADIEAARADEREKAASKVANFRAHLNFEALMDAMRDEQMPPKAVHALSDLLDAFAVAIRAGGDA